MVLTFVEEVTTLRVSRLTRDSPRRTPAGYRNNVPETGRSRPHRALTICDYLPFPFKGILNTICQWGTISVNMNTVISASGFRSVRPSNFESCGSVWQLFFQVVTTLRYVISSNLCWRTPSAESHLKDTPKKMRGIFLEVKGTASFCENCLPRMPYKCTSG